MASNDPNQGARGLLGRKGNRLPSLKGPRDLTLGGVQKKTFTPNIPARPRDKIKEEPKDASCSNDGDKPRKHDKSRRDRGRGRGRGGRGRGRGEREVIQSHSIFEQGPTEGLKKSSGSWGGDAVERASSGRASGSIKREKMDDAETKRVLDDILQDDFIVDNNRKSTDPSMMPIKLPVSREEVKVENKAEIKPKIKTEPDVESVSSGSTEKTDVDMKDVAKSASPTPSVDSFHPASAAQLFTGASKSDLGEFIFIQLPDALPGDPSGRDDDPRAKKNASQGQTQGQNAGDSGQDVEAELAKRLGLCQMEDFSEGYIGKIQVHRSGKTRLVLGNAALDVDLGATPGFLQELVSVRIGEAAQEGDMAVLGHVKHKLVCVPDFEAMLET